MQQYQGPDNMQIEVVDDCSNIDNPEKIVREVGQGDVNFYRQPENVGVVKNFNTCIQRARGKWVHILHGDDLVMPGFYQRYEQLIRRYPETTLIIGPSVYIDENNNQMSTSPIMASEEGPVLDFLPRQAVRNWIRTPSVVIPRRVYEELGGYNESLTHTADWEMFFRAGLSNQVVTTVDPFTEYRIHSRSDTSLQELSGNNIAEYVLTIELCLQHLSSDTRLQITPAKYDWAINRAKDISLKLAERKQWKGSLRQATWVLRLKFTYQNFKFWIWACSRYIKFKLFGN